MFRLAAWCATSWWCAALLAGDVEGVIRVTRKLTRHRVTPVAPAYYRGIPVSETRTVAFAKPGIVQVYCHLHPNMADSIVVTPNRWAGRPSQAAGDFRKRIRVGPAPQKLDFEIPVDVDQP
jgi:hypothetical protein